MITKTDEILAGAVAHGDLDALGELFERHHKRVHAICYRMTGEPSSADDLVQESFLRVLRYSKSYDAKAAFTTWLYRLARNVCLDHLSRENRSNERVQLMNVEQRTDHSPGSEPYSRLDTVHAALYRLPSEKREILVLSRYEGMSYAEIAEVCDTTVGAIKVRAHRAMRELRKIFEELEQQHEV